jgi:predicted acetyltransferase
MGKLHIQRLKGKDWLTPTHFLRNYAFPASPPLLSEEEDKKRWSAFFELGEGYYLSDGDKPLACALDIPFQQNVRGKLLPMSGVGSVAVHPEARRNGYARQVMKSLLAGAKNRGAVVSTLFPFLESFYERLGYVNFPYRQSLTFESKCLAPLLQMKLSGSLRLFSMREGYAAYRSFVETYFQQAHGFAWTEAGWWDRKQRDQDLLWMVLAKNVEGKAIGLMLYRLSGHGEPLVAERFFYLNSEGKYLLLHYLARHIGQASPISMNLAIPGIEAPFLSDLNPKAGLLIPPMGRVIDLMGLQDLPVGEGQFSVRIEDSLCPWQTGSWTFSGEDSRLSVAPCVGAEEELSIQGLSALVYGTHDAGDFAFRQWGKPSETTQAQMRSLFSPQHPYLHEEF